MLLRLFKPLFITASLTSLIFVLKENNYGSSGYNTNINSMKEKMNEEKKKNDKNDKKESNGSNDIIIKNHSVLENSEKPKVEKVTKENKDVKLESKSTVVENKDKVNEDDEDIDDGEIDIDCPCLDNMKKGPCMI